ncbi:hypothetical protein D3H65_09540 [Paraflavitalea soli]|uniref:Copper-binding protein MbnP-like domain-containing protein n=1 Tax=Paraflavitalea soli TaxID=2315862 RepID=A0A3B7MMC3_9BACT|nr:MbnP family protein [Paraflavitalea soli]AXY74200.1 hypothetical protein D3H65_09540 [Paraflavitalea soli]
MFGIPVIIMMIMLATADNSGVAKKASLENKAPLSIEFDHIVGGQNLQLNTGSYTNAAGDTFSVSLLQYFVSNIQLTTANGTAYVVPQDSSYFLIKEGDPQARFARVNVPEGEYTSLSFVLGVDSLRSTMDISQRKGVLDPSGGMDGMYWGWNSGYIFFKMEGISPQAPLDPGGQHKFRYHIGGFGGYSAPTINNIRTVTIDLTNGGIAKVSNDRKTNIHLLVDIAKAFAGDTNVSIAANSTVMFSAFSARVANNYTAMFHHDHTEN